MKQMFIKNATDVRKEWGSVIDTVVREKPVFVKRSRDIIYLLNQNNINQLLSNYNFTAKEFMESDGSITLSLNEIDIIANALSHEEALNKLAFELTEYAEEYYSDFEYWYASMNRKSHYPYILRVLSLDDKEKLKELIACQAGKI